MVALQTVEIPGFREAVRKERALRDSAFLGGNELVCGVEVVPFSLRRLIWLEAARNGFVVPCTFDNLSEMLAHALQVLYFNSPSFKPPVSPVYSFWRSFRDGCQEQMFIRRVIKRHGAVEAINEVKLWLEDAFMDASGGGSSSEIAAPSYAAYPALLIDKFAEAGLPFSYDAMLDMPLRRLWQHWRMAINRLDGVSLNNPSDEIAVKYLAGVRP